MSIEHLGWAEASHRRTTVSPAHIGCESVRLARVQERSRLPIIVDLPIKQAIVDYDVWDMWPLAYPNGSTVVAHDRQYWFLLATPMLEDPEDRHDIARIRLASFGSDGWRDHGWALPDAWSPGSREWSGCTVLDYDGRTVIMYFTATGRRGEPHSFEQRLFEGSCELMFDADVPSLRNWSKPVESVKSDGHWYKVADQVVAPPHGIWGFRDPGYFCDPANGAEHLLFAGSAGWTDDRLDGVIGLATRSGPGWELQPPLIQALGVNSELERPHIVVRDGLYYCFWSSHGRRYATDLGAPTGLYGMVAEQFRGPWRPLNGSGLVAANPLESPFQAYCWWVTGEGDVISFVDYPGAQGAEPPRTALERREIFGGTVAPVFQLVFDGDVVLPQTAAGKT